MNKIVIAVIILVILLLIGAAVGIYFGVTKGKIGGTSGIGGITVGKPTFAPKITRLRVVRCADPSGMEVDYGMEVGNTIYTCRAGSKTKVENSDVLVFDPAASRPKGTVKLWMTFNNNVPQYTLTGDAQPTNDAVLLGYVWLSDAVLPAADFLNLRVNTAVLAGNRNQTYLTTRPESEATKYGWAAGPIIAKVPSKTDIGSYNYLTAF
jgi:hypothetical protein